MGHRGKLYEENPQSFALPGFFIPCTLESELSGAGIKKPLDRVKGFSS